MDAWVYFSWVDIWLIAGWPVWLPLGCNSLLLPLLIERLWYLWKPFRMKKRWRKGEAKGIISRASWERLFWKEQQHLHMGLYFLKSMMVVCFLLGLLGSLINAAIFLNQEEIGFILKPSMWVYCLIKLGVPFGVGSLSALFGAIFFRLYLIGSASMIKRYVAWFPVTKQ